MVKRVGKKLALERVILAGDDELLIGANREQELEGLLRKGILGVIENTGKWE